MEEGFLSWEETLKARKHDVSPAWVGLRILHNIQGGYQWNPGVKILLVEHKRDELFSFCGLRTHGQKIRR